jgi:hypothetical protein
MIRSGLAIIARVIASICCSRHRHGFLIETLSEPQVEPRWKDYRRRSDEFQRPHRGFAGIELVVARDQFRFAPVEPSALATRNKMACGAVACAASED